MGVIDCVQNEGAPVVADPLANLPAASLPSLAPDAVEIIGLIAGPGRLSGSVTEATYTAAAVCQFPSSYAGTVWRLYPGLYPGGMVLQGGTSTSSPVPTTLVWRGPPHHRQRYDDGHCRARGRRQRWTGRGGPLLQRCDSRIPGGPGHPQRGLGEPQPAAARRPLIVLRWPRHLPDRAVSVDPGHDVTINGSASGMNVRGTIYVPNDGCPSGWRMVTRHCQPTARAVTRRWPGRSREGDFSAAASGVP